MDLTLAICVYNAAKYIEETLDSVMAQTAPNFRLLIVNDCSTDNSAEIVERYFALHHRQYELVDFGENRGICYARHFAERHAETKYMMFLDADDCLRPEAVEKMYGKITSDPDLMAVGCYLDYIDEKGKKLGGGLYLGETTKEAFYEKASKAKLIFMQPTAVYDRNLALSVGGYEIDGFPAGRPRYQDYCEDLDLWTRMSDLHVAGKAIVVIPEVLCLYRKGSGLSSSSFNMILKMRYTKANLLRRRAGVQPELTFVQFCDSLSEKELKALHQDAEAADCLRNGVVCLKNGQIVKCLKNIIRSIYLRPGYLLDKIKNNLIKKR